jgi:hypothetical protein
LFIENKELELEILGKYLDVNIGGEIDSKILISES